MPVGPVRGKQGVWYVRDAALQERIAAAAATSELRIRDVSAAVTAAVRRPPSTRRLRLKRAPRKARKARQGNGVDQPATRGRREFILRGKLTADGIRLPIRPSKALRLSDKDPRPAKAPAHDQPVQQNRSDERGSICSATLADRYQIGRTPARLMHLMDMS